MKKNSLFPVSLQSQIEHSRLGVESELDKAFKLLRIRTSLNRAGISKKKGFDCASLLFGVLLFPLIAKSLTALWSGKYITNMLEAKKDVYYRMLNNPRFNWRMLLSMLAIRIINIMKKVPLKEKLIIV